MIVADGLTLHNIRIVIIWIFDCGRCIVVDRTDFGFQITVLSLEFRGMNDIW